MATTKLYHDCRRSKGDTPAPLKIAITKHGRTALLPLNIKLTPSQWDSRKGCVVGHPQRQSLNNYIYRRLLEVNTLLGEMDLNGTSAHLTATEIKNYIQRKIGGEHELEAERCKLLPRLMNYAQRCRKQRTRELYEATASRIVAFAKNAASLRLDDITPEWLADFNTFLARTSPARNARNIHMRNIRAVINAAINDGITTCYPFRRYKILPEPTRPRAYSVDTLRRLFSYPCEPWQAKYIDLFKLIFMLIGINTVDLYNAVKLDGDRLYYIRSKTSRPYSIRVEPEAMEIINRHRGSRKLLAEAEACHSSKTFMMSINRGLQSIGTTHRERKFVKGKLRNVLVRDSAFVGLTTYVARHSWATIAAELDIPKETIAAALGHGGNTVTDIYIAYDRRKVDEANRRVIDYVLYG